MREGIDELFPLADILLFSRAFVSGRGFDSAAAFFDAISGQAPGGMLICTWGDQGAYARDAHRRDYHSPAFPPAKVVDTIGAGDTFNAGLIDALASGRTLEQALSHACRLAGRKVGQLGFDHLRET